MAWQDIILTVGSWIFAIVLVPSIRSKTDKPALSSSLLTATLCTVYIFVYISLRFWTTSVSMSVLAAAWWVLAYQKWRMNKTMDEFIRISTVFEVPPDVIREAVRLCKDIIGHRKVFFELSEHALYPLQVHPHITIYSPEYPHRNLDQILEKAEEVAHASAPISFRFDRFECSDDGYLFARFTLTPEIRSFQKKLIKELNPLREGHVSEFFEDNLFDPQLPSFVVKHGEKNVLDAYKPHLTITRFLTPADAKTCSVGIQWGVTSFTVDRIGVYITGEHGTLHEPLAEFLLSS